MVDYSNLPIGKWVKSKYTIVGKFPARDAEKISELDIDGYVYRITEDLALGICNKKPDGSTCKGWPMSVLPEGLYWKNFRIRKDAEAFAIAEKEHIIEYIGKAREAMRK